jgi:hypothetical protein
MAKWYRYHGYNFIAITDLNSPTPVEGLKALYDELETEKFLVMPGIEVNVEPRGKIFDSQGVGGNNKAMWDAWKKELPSYLDVPRSRAAEILDLQGKIIRSAGGIPMPTHPNLAWSWDHEDILKTDAKNIRHFEMRTGEPGMNDLGGGGKPSTEEMWDNILSTGRVMYGVAGDDSHHLDGDHGPTSFFAEGKPHVQAKALPGRTSIYVLAQKLEPKQILDAIDRGHFYSVEHFMSLPIVFESYVVDRTGIRLRLPRVNKDIGWSSHADGHQPGPNDAAYRTYFIGKGGEVLKVDESLTPSYNFTGSELYVRVRVHDSDGGIAWTQPVFLRK